MRWILSICLVLTFSVPASAQLSFSKVEARTGYGLAKEGDKGNLVLDNDTIRLVKKNGTEYFSLPTDAVTDMFYSRVSGRRIKTAIFVSPLLLLTKGRKHYVTITFDDPRASGAVELRLDKKNYMGILRSLEQVSGMSMQYDQEGIKDTEQDVAARKRAVLDISSNPEGADIEINGGFKGNTPDLTSVQAGEYTVRVFKAGYEPWERQIVLDPGEKVNIQADLTKQ